MRLSDFGALLWALIVIAAVFSSLRRAAGRVRAVGKPPASEPRVATMPQVAATPRMAVTQRIAAAQRMAATQRGTAARETARQIVDALRVADAPPVVAPPVVAPPVVAAPLPPASPRTEELPVEFMALEIVEDPTAERATQIARPLSGRRLDWASGVVIAELLSPPLAMRESGPPTW